MKTQLRSLLAGGILACSPAFAQTTISSTLSTDNVVLCTAPVADEIQTLCAGAKVGNIAALTNTGAVVKWYLVGIVLQQIPVTQEISDGSRYGVTQTVDGCTSPMTYVTVNLTGALDAPAGAGTQDFTTGETLADLEITIAEGNTVKWYTRNAALEYTLAQTSLVLTNGTTYYATQFNGTCESDYLPVTANEILSTGNVVLKNLSVYPNPATAVVTINGKDIINQVVVSNLLGQKVLTQTNNATNAQVNIAALTAGTYALQVYTAQGTATVKIIKQ